MDTEIKIAKAGKLLLLDSGEYSDYTVVGLFAVLKDFEPMKELEEYKAANPEKSKDYNFGEDAFLAAIISKGYLMEVEYGNLYLGSYGCCRDVRFTPTNGE